MTMTTRRMFLYSVGLLANFPSGLLASTFKQGCVVTIHSCTYSFYYSHMNMPWELRCIYSIDDGERKPVVVQGTPKAEKVMKIPGTSVEIRLDPDIIKFHVSHDIDVRQVIRGDR